MKVEVKTNFQFSISSIQWSPDGGLVITISSPNGSDSCFAYKAELGDSVEEKPTVSLVEYLCRFSNRMDIKRSTQSSYALTARYVKEYGDCNLDKITTEYLQRFIEYLKSRGFKGSTVTLCFQKVVCVLNDAYSHELFDIRILKRVARSKRDNKKKGFLTVTELKRLVRTQMPEKHDNVRKMFIFSCLTGLRFSDIKKLKWSDLKRAGGRMHLEFRQQKTGTAETLPLCSEAEAILRDTKRSGQYVFDRVSNPWTNKILRRWSKEARIAKPVTFHMARHTFCVMLLNEGVPIYTVQRLMCHTDIGSTNIYADIAGKTKTKAVGKLPNISGLGVA